MSDIGAIVTQLGCVIIILAIAGSIVFIFGPVVVDMFNDAEEAWKRLLK